MSENVNLRNERNPSESILTSTWCTISSLEPQFSNIQLKGLPGVPKGELDTILNFTKKTPLIEGINVHTGSRGSNSHNKPFPLLSCFRLPTGTYVRPNTLVGRYLHSEAWSRCPVTSGRLWCLRRQRKSGRRDHRGWRSVSCGRVQAISTFRRDGEGLTLVVMTLRAKYYAILRTLGERW